MGRLDAKQSGHPRRAADQAEDGLILDSADRL
jgi:hypothetical protein